MSPEIFEFRIPFNELNVTPEKVIRFINSRNDALSGYSFEFLEEFLNKSVDYADIKGGFIFVSSENFRKQKENFLIEKTEFISGRIITAKLFRADSAALFTVTAGNYFENKAKELIDEGDIFSGYLADAAASEIAEAAAEWLEKKIDQFASERSLKTTSRYSPGYCGWSVSEQHKLFSFFPKNFCGIKLTSSALMIPIKSVSGIVGLGANAVKEEYDCSVCEDENCFRRNH
jgi:hypothetical protein